MKITRLLLIICLCLSSSACSEEQADEPEKKEVSVWAGETKHVSIETDLTHYNYTLKSENEEIATAIMNNNTQASIYVITHKKGKTMIRLIDIDNNKILCEITVYANYFGSPEIIDCGIPQEGYPGYPGIFVKAKDVETLKNIENELWTEGLTLIGVIYSFNRDTQKFTMKTDAGIFYEGTYEWDITSLTLIHNNKIEKYGFQFAIGMMNRYLIQVDKTEEYQQRYPDAGITEVKVNRIWYDSGKIQTGELTF